MGSKQSYHKDVRQLSHVAQCNKQYRDVYGMTVERALHNAYIEEGRFRRVHLKYHSHLGQILVTHPMHFLSVELDCTRTWISVTRIDVMNALDDLIRQGILVPGNINDVRKRYEPPNHDQVAPVIVPSSLDNIVDRVEQNESMQCVVCMDNARNIMLLPCNHVCLCKSCSDQLTASTHKCPVCNVEYTQRLGAYIS